MTLAQSNFARSLWAARQALFPSFQAKRYHLQFRHATLIGLAMMCAAFTMPAYHQTMPFAESVYNTSDEVPVEPGYNRVRRFMRGIMYYNVVLAGYIALHIVAEPIFQRSAPVWYEITWMLLFVVGEVVCLGLMASSRPLDICDRSYPIVPVPDPRGGFVDTNSAMSVCSNWRGMTGLLAAIIGVFMLHATWHMIVSFRHRTARQGVLTYPITDYRWYLPAGPETRIKMSDDQPTTSAASAAAVEEKKEETINEMKKEEGGEKKEKKKIRVKLETSDKEIIEVDADVAFKSRLLKEMMKDLGVEDAEDNRLDEPMELSQVDGKTLKKILEYCEKHKDEEYKPKGEHEDPRIKLTDDDNAYMDVPSEELVAILLGANFLDIPGIVDIITQKIANMAEGKTVEELREIFGLENDFTPEEEEEIKQRFAWVEV